MELKHIEKFIETTGVGFYDILEDETDPQEALMVVCGVVEVCLAVLLGDREGPSPTNFPMQLAKLLVEDFKSRSGGQRPD